MKILVTGGSGFILSHVSEHFVRLGHEVTILDRFSYAGKARNLAGIIDKVELVIADTAESDLEYRLGDRKFDVCIHGASETHVDRSITDPLCFQRSNVIGTTRMLEYLRQHQPQIQRVIVYSTDETFGPTPLGVAFDENAPMKPSNSYAASKVAMEALAHAYWVTHKLPTVVMRSCNTYGTRQHPEKVIPKFVRQMLSGHSVTLYNDGRGSRDWLHTHDHARAVALLMEKGVAGTSYNLAAGEEHTDADIAERIAAVLKSRDDAETIFSQISYVPGRPGHDRRYFMDGSRIRALGWKPIVPFEDGFRETVLWNAQNTGYWDSDVVRLKDTVQMATALG